MHRDEYENLLAMYKHSDFGRRLDIFLAYPRLRNDFIAIEMGEASPAFAGGSRQPRLPRFSTPKTGLMSGSIH